MEINSMKKLQSQAGFVLTFLAAGMLFVGCAGLPKQLTKVQRMEQPPAGKALINFHRPSTWGGGMYPIFDINGKMVMDLLGACEFQAVCEPGENVFMGWADHVSVLKADVAADKVYDVMVDVSMGVWKPNIYMAPLAKGDPRRSKLAEFERREKTVLALNRNQHVIDYEAKNQKRVQEIKQDFLSGQKSDRVKYLQKDDCR
jgi:hypothetical protein